VTNNARVPIDPGPHQHRLAVWQKLKHFYEIDVYRIGHEPGGLLQERADIIDVQRAFAKLGQRGDLLPQLIRFLRFSEHFLS
jgi:hypothetical protein